MSQELVDKWVAEAHPPGEDQPPVTVTKDEINAAVQAARDGKTLPKSFTSKVTQEQSQLLVELVEIEKNPPVVEPEPVVPSFEERLDDLERRLDALERQSQKG